ncbi:PAS domain S-box protein [Piscinibacter sp.]|uniref:PAS domain S-box protein n=1 Tax=Piscinibacter sp. TaxID=1903157 RepID=UPI0039E653E1
MELTSARAGLDRRLLWFNLLVLALVAALVGLSQHGSRDAAMERARIATENIAAALAQGLGTELDRVDIGLRNAALGFEAEAAAGAPDAARIEAQLARQLELLPQLQSIRIADAQGTVRHGRGVAEAPRTSVADREDFALARDGGAPGSLVSGPMQTRIGQHWVVAVARPLRDARGGFAGMIWANVDVARFAPLLDGVDLGRAGAITVRGGDLALVARRSAAGAPEAPPVGSRSVSAELQRALAEQPDAGTFIARTAIDGVERINAYRRVGATPMIVLAGLATDDFLGPWRAQTRQVALLAALALLVLAASSLLLHRAWAGEARSARSLIREGERHRALLRAAGDGMHVLDREGRLVEMSDSFAAMTGYTRDELAGRHMSLWVADMEPDEMARRMRSFEVGTAVRFGGRHRRKDGSVFDVEVVCLGVRIEGEELLFCSSRDVTERRAQARELKRYRDHLETLVAERTGQWRAALAREQGLRAGAEAQARSLRELLEQREEFLRLLAHEVRQPLNNASAALQSALSALPAEGGAAERIARAQAVIRQIVGSLDNTLAASALLASARPLDPRDADVGALIELSLGDLDASRRSRVRVERVSPTRTASMDIALMRLALRNVLGNALAYSAPDAPVLLRVVDSDEPLALVFEVADEGPGIAAELMPRLFERGARGAHGLPGHGIGLHVVRRVMELHGGSVDVRPLRPQAPHGAVFRLWLPQGR